MSRGGKAPFPYSGGKARAVNLVWGRFGRDCTNYVEPFFGSGAMLLGAPEPLTRRGETVNDADCFLVNFWRAVQFDPEGVAGHAVHLVSELDLQARHGWLLNRREGLRKLLGHPDAYDVKAAGWWLYGVCLCIGGVWCSGRGKWKLDEDLGEIVNGGTGCGGFDKAIFNSCSVGIFSTLGEVDRLSFVKEWMTALHVRLRNVRVACGDWKRVLGRSFCEFEGLTGIFLDPPYSKGDYLYGTGDFLKSNKEVSCDVALDVRDWCIANGDNARLRIALCGHDGEHDALLSYGWEKGYWEATQGRAKKSKLYEGETIWFSPHCLSSVSLPSLF